MTLKTVKKVLREYSEKSDAVAKSLGGEATSGLSSNVKVHSSETAI